MVWFTGLSGAGKSTTAERTRELLAAAGVHAAHLDGDQVRQGLSRDLGFTHQDRTENVRRVGEVARLMADAGLVVLVSLISPFAADRQMVREIVAPVGFSEVYVDATLAVAEARDPKGLYRRARTGELAELTGVSSPYEPPADPDVHLDTAALDPDQAAAAVVDHLRAVGLVAGAADRAAGVSTAG